MYKKMQIYDLEKLPVKGQKTAHSRTKSDTTLLK